MASANNMQERELLKDFAAGVERWVANSTEHAEQFKRITRIGRWAESDLNPNQLSYEYAEAYKDCDVAVFFGSWKPREKGSHQTRSAVVANAKRFICIETPLLNRVTDKENSYWRIGVNGFLNQDADWPTLSSADAEIRLKELNISWNGWNSNPKGHILLALQLPGDASLRGADINDWAYRTILDIRQKSDRTIIIRNHPLSSHRAFADHEELVRKLLIAGVDNIRLSDGSAVSWAADLHKAYCTVTYTSGLAIDSVLAGVPTIACDPGNFAWGFSTNLPSEINDIKLADTETIQHWLYNLAGCQWNSKEMRSGLAWAHLLPVVNKIK